MILRTGNRTQRLASSVQRLGDYRYAKRYTLYAKKGLTLIEVLLAVSILGLGIIGVLRGYASSIAALEAGQLTLNGTELARQKMADVEQEFIESEELPKSGGQGVFDEPYEDFSWEWTVEPVDPELKDLYMVSLVVSRETDQRTFALRTYVVDKKSEQNSEEEE